MTRNCLNLLRKVASVTKKAEESPYIFGKWTPLGLLERGGRALGRRLGLNYDNNPEGWNQRTRPTRQEVLDHLQKQYDRGGRWRTPEGMNSLALMAGSDAHDGNVYARQRAVEQGYIDSMRRRQKAFQTLAAEEPEYYTSRGYYNTEAKKLGQAADTWQKDIDAAREERMAEGRKLFFDQGGRWSILRQELPKLNLHGTVFTK